MFVFHDRFFESHFPVPRKVCIFDRRSLFVFKNNPETLSEFGVSVVLRDLLHEFFDNVWVPGRFFEPEAVQGA